MVTDPLTLYIEFARLMVERDLRLLQSQGGKEIGEVSHSNGSTVPIHIRRQWLEALR
jgi:hypothetical protein